METNQMRIRRMQEKVLQTAEKMLEHPDLVAIFADFPEVDAAQLIPELSKLMQFTQDKQNCISCSGLEQCPNVLQGHFCTVEVAAAAEGKLQIIDRKASCNLFRTHQHQLKIRKNVRSFYINDEHLSRGYDEVEIMQKDRQRASAVKQIYEYIESTKNSGLKSTGLYLEGIFGTGKTYLAGYLLQELAIAGYTGVIVYMPDFVEELKSMISDNQKLQETIETLKKCDLLIFDDIGAENLNPWVRDHILGSVLNFRMNKKPTFYTSNFSLRALQRHFAYTSKDGIEQDKASRIMERIAPYVDVVTVRGVNQRGN